ncbi:REP-associated tyrosine transposase [Haloferula sp.]|uniref:REP-associated tyrosine transposase n=1 Tax=Haloferula sp. TaxID=2497595 RepID=UPI003C715644
MDPRPQKGWYSRGYLPHMDASGVIQAVTFRLADSLPKAVLRRWNSELAASKDDPANIKLRKKIAAYEDAGHGACLLRNPQNAIVVQDALLFFDGDRYHLLEWVIMPNHVHVLLRPEGDTIDRIIKTWKTHTAKTINRLIGTSGAIWERDYFDRYIRDESHYLAAKNYIHHNPVKAGLCASPGDWLFGSASGSADL